VWVRYRREDGPLLCGPLTIGFSVYGDAHHFGPELQFGWLLGEHFANQVLLIKTAWGGKSLYKDFARQAPRPGRTILHEDDRRGARSPGKPEDRFPQLRRRRLRTRRLRLVPRLERRLRAEHRRAAVRRQPGEPHQGRAPGTGRAEPAGGHRGADRPVGAGPGRVGRPAQGPGRGRGTPRVPRQRAVRRDAQFVRRPDDSPNPGHGHHEFGNAETYFLVGDALGKGMVKLLAARQSPGKGKGREARNTSLPDSGVGVVAALSEGLHGYIGFGHERHPPKSAYTAGMGFYAAVWPLVDQPLADFQIGLPSSWITPDNSDNQDQPLAPEGTLARKWRERGPTWDSDFHTVEAGWATGGQPLPLWPAKFSMNATPQCYDYEVGMLNTHLTRYDQGGKRITGVERVFDTRIFEGNAWGLQWFASNLIPQGIFPQYYKHVGDERVAVAAADVPTETGLLTEQFKLARPGNPYTSPVTGAWSRPGPKRGPFTAGLADGSVVTYSWYRFIDQPSFQQYS